MTPGRSPKLDALRAMREAQFTGQASSRPTTAALREVITTTEDDMAKRKVKKAKPVKAKRKAPAKPKPKARPRRKAPRPPKAPPADAGLTPNETKLLEYLKDAPRSRPQINKFFGWVDHTARSTLARLKAKIAVQGLALTKSKTNGVNFYVVAG